jgi:hypothetical protein
MERRLGGRLCERAFTRRGFALAVIVAGALMTAAVGLASSVTMGNAAVDRAVLDEYSNFTIADQSNPADADGLLDQITYYAKLDPAHRAQNGVPFAVVRAVPGKPVLEMTARSRWSGSARTSRTRQRRARTRSRQRRRFRSRPATNSHCISPATDSCRTTTSPSPKRSDWEPSNHGKPTVGEELTIEWPNPDQLPAGFEDVNKRNYSVQGSTIDCTFSIGQPINADSSSVFKAGRGVIPVKLIPSAATAT